MWRGAGVEGRGAGHPGEREWKAGVENVERSRLQVVTSVPTGHRGRRCQGEASCGQEERKSLRVPLATVSAARQKQPRDGCRGATCTLPGGDNSLLPKDPAGQDRVSWGICWSQRRGRVEGGVSSDSVSVLTR